MLERLGFRSLSAKALANGVDGSKGHLLIRRTETRIGGICGLSVLKVNSGLD